MAKKQTVTLNVRYPSQYGISMMANRFLFEKLEGSIVVDFGLVNEKEITLDRCCAIVTEHSLKSQRENLVTFSDKIGKAKKKIPGWSPKPREILGLPLSLQVVDYIHLSHWDDAYGEICFWNFSQGYVADLVQAKSNEPILANGVVMVRCTLDYQRAFLEDLCDLL